jgi:hypothetical protein
MKRCLILLDTGIRLKMKENKNIEDVSETGM